MKLFITTLGLCALVSLAAAQDFLAPRQVEVPTEWVDRIDAGEGHAFAFQLGDTMAVVYLEFSGASDLATAGQVRFYTGTRHIVRFGRLIPTPQVANRGSLGDEQWYAACFRVGSDGYGIIAFYGAEGENNVGVRVAPGVFDPNMLTAMVTGTPASSTPRGRFQIRHRDGSSVSYEDALDREVESPLTCYRLAAARRRWWRRTTLVNLIASPVLVFSGK